MQASAFQREEISLAEQVRRLLLSEMRPSKQNPRKTFDPESLEELARSIREVGVIQPIVVVPARRGYQIVAGERRWRAARIAGLERIPAVVRHLSRSEVAKLAFIENLQRRDLNPVEEARGIEGLVSLLKLPAEEIAEMIGKSPSYVYGRRRLLELPPRILGEVAAGRLSAVSALTINRLSNDEDKTQVALEAVRNTLTVAQVESLVRDRLNTRLRHERSLKRDESYNRKLEALKAKTGKQVVAYNDFDSTLHQRVWNLRFPECRGCELKGVLLTRDFREEDLCVVPTCYRRLEARERSERAALSAREASVLRNELEKVLHSEFVKPVHIQLIAYTLLDLAGPLADQWVTSRGIGASYLGDGRAGIWSWLGTLSEDDLITAVLELAVLHLSSGGGDSLPTNLMRDLAASFALDLASVVRARNSEEITITYETVGATAFEVR
jgi:ParB family chromosome partitioning protein